MTSQAPTTRSNTSVAWVLYVLQLLGTAVLGFISIFSVFMTDSCGSVADEPAVCDTGYLGGVVFGFWAALLVLIIAVPIGIIRSSRRGGATWAWPLAAIVLSGGLSVLFGFLILR